MTSKYWYPSTAHADNAVPSQPRKLDVLKRIKSPDPCSIDPFLSFRYYFSSFPFRSFFLFLRDSHFCVSLRRYFLRNIKKRCCCFIFGEEEDDAAVRRLTWLRLLFSNVSSK